MRQQRVLAALRDKLGAAAKRMMSTQLSKFTEQAKILETAAEKTQPINKPLDQATVISGKPTYPVVEQESTRGLNERELVTLRAMQSDIDKIGPATREIVDRLHLDDKYFEGTIREGDSVSKYIDSVAAKAQPKIYTKNNSNNR